MVVVALRPGRFYGSALPRPRFYPNVKFNDERVDPPPAALDPLLGWAREAHWSMGGLSFQRHRLQGRIEGSIKKLRAEAERKIKEEEAGKKRKLRAVDPAEEIEDDGVEEEEKEDEERAVKAIPTPRPRQRRRLVIPDDGAFDSDSSGQTKLVVEESEPSSSRPRRTSARKLGDEFDRVAGISNREGRTPRSDSSLSASGVPPRARNPREEGTMPSPAPVESGTSSEISKGRRSVGAVAPAAPEAGRGSPRTSPRLRRSPRG
ncbi:unnamed protein product [Spirodela intermedia]|uniref:Uncharacterized protein n=1 Tax=Spirodela intermedia TaxID=51605 RepID=A0A7I8JHC7_SPIIN|nr:unnamed protein product [Spirodela intermedia]CAA6668822.1 unnamed protein product [Spirodela intermedia]